MLVDCAIEGPLALVAAPALADEPAPSLPEAIETARRLTALLDEEISLLRELHLEEIRELAEEKIQLAAAWATQTARLRADRAFVETVEPRLRDELAEVIDTLEQSARTNASALRAALDAHDRLFRTIAAAAQEQRGSQSPAGYGAGGHRPALGGHAVGMAVNRSL